MFQKYLELTLEKKKNNMPNRIYYKLADYKSREELYNALFKQMAILLDSNNVMSICQHPIDKSLFLLEFDTADQNLSTEFPLWLDAEEIEMILNGRNIPPIITPKDNKDDGGIA